MESQNRLPEHDFEAKGPEGLGEVLSSILEQAQKDPEFAQKQHLILYVLGQQKAIITVDTNQQPFHFHYDDLLGRPATKAVKDTIARFLWEKCGEKEKYNQLDKEGGQ